MLTVKEKNYSRAEDLLNLCERGMMTLELYFNADEIRRKLRLKKINKRETTVDDNSSESRSPRKSLSIFLSVD